MARTVPPSFHLRLPPELKAKLQAATSESGNSLNSEIVERLDRSFEPDTAQQLAEVFRPFISSLDEADQAKLVRSTSETVNVLMRANSKRRTSRQQ